MKNLLNRFFKGYFLASLILLFASVAVAKVTYTGLDMLLFNDQAGELSLGTSGAKDIVFTTNASSSDPESFIFDDSIPAIVPAIDDNIDLGTASLEFQDGYFDGTVTADNLSLPISVVAGANTACSTTCTGFCFFGVNTAATEADIVDCADATADECLCAE